VEDCQSTFFCQTSYKNKTNYKHGELVTIVILLSSHLKGLEVKRVDIFVIGLI